MSAKQSELSFEGDMSRDELLSHLEEFAASMRDGTVRVELGEQQLVLTAAEVVKLAVKAKTKGDAQSVRLELSWPG
ncbi:hypothetical protein ENSA5_61610 [Enhygromyxa salina]|uniref:Amphi-Trp domain-containing protein n=1 Tax=Enhygromyxa salina TaxID=215803 RepID=A0A2S9XCY6_9BACT|nr:amphi-Trp domain-containing protein [Enhygromyxa salina]PRP90727.1 hypothetical protein ENSA5_61610 [Enhygromyxa salina]